MSLPAEPERGGRVTDGGAGVTSGPCLTSSSVPADTTWACPTCGHPLWSAHQGESEAPERLRSGVDLPTVLAQWERTHQTR
jgi:hypothetical protein